MRASRCDVCLQTSPVNVKPCAWRFDQFGNDHKQSAIQQGVLDIGEPSYRIFRRQIHAHQTLNSCSQGPQYPPTAISPVQCWLLLCKRNSLSWSSPWQDHSQGMDVQMVMEPAAFESLPKQQDM